MKKLSVILALVLSLVLCVFAFASCGKDKAKSTTAAPETTAATTECAHEWSTEYTIDVPATCAQEGSKSIHCSKCNAMKPGSTEPIEKTAHIPSDDYTTDKEPTCLTAGSKSRHCVQCGQIVESTVVPLEIDENAHKVEEWVTVEPTLLSPNGSKTGTCVICDNPVVEKLTYEPDIWSANDKASGNKVDKRLYSTIRGEDHFYPTAENDKGNDLLIEFSILYNETLSHGNGWTFDITVGNGSDFVNLKLNENANARYGTVVGGFSARDRNDGKGAILSTPSAAAIAADPSAKYPSIGDYGWHRVAIRIHQEATIVEGAVVYVFTGEAYLDGELILAFDLSKWAKDNMGALLYTATIEDDQLVYHDNDALNAWGEIAIYDFYKGTDIYCAIADTYMTCGHDFVQQVEAVADPVPATLTLDDLGTEDTSDDVIAPAAMYFQAKVD
ncbi:MAG: hypothetical protein J6X72_02740 [Clostridia bacterium]|nr:hypothetical protein [Clostridia bacterium]